MASGPPLTNIGHLGSPNSFLREPVMAVRGSSPEPVTDADIQKIKARLIQLGIVSSNKNLTPREKELANVVFKLANAAASRPDTEQVARQATTIINLSEQRDYLITQAEEERARWESEKEGWTRMAEALIAQRGKTAGLVKDEEAERKPSIQEFEIRVLRSKLAEAQSRLTTVESELNRLRPLLMQSIPVFNPHEPVPATSRQHKTRSITNARKNAPGTTSDDEEEFTNNPGVPRTDYYRRNSNQSMTLLQPAVSIPAAISKQRQAFPSAVASSSSSKKTSLLSDARAEHILLAARRLGRMRVNALTEFMHAHTLAEARDHERERKQEEERRRLEAEWIRAERRDKRGKDKEANAGKGQAVSTPKTPKVAADDFAYANSPDVLVPVFVPVALPPGNSQSIAKTPHQTSDTNAASNPPTPLDSLLSAARSMMDGGQQKQVRTRGRSRVQSAGDSDIPDSPVPKRRRLDSGISLSRRAGDGSRGSSSSGETRVRSALDVLADQAAAFSSKEKESEPVAPSRVRTRSSKGKEKKEGETTIAHDKGKSRSVGHHADGHHFLGSWEVDPPRLTPVTEWGSSEGGKGDSSRGVHGDTIHSSDPPEHDPEEGPSTTGTRPLEENPHRRPPSSPALALSPSLMSTLIPMDNSPSLAAPLILQSQRSQSEDCTNGRHQQQSTYSELSRMASMDSHRRATSIPARSASHSNDAPPGQEVFSSGRMRRETAPQVMTARNPDIARVTTSDVSSTSVLASGAAKRPRSPYVKWSKEEDDMLAQAVAKYGQKWDLVQKALPSRGYHQVRQRWLRKLGVFDSKPDLANYQNGTRITGVDANGNVTGGPAPSSMTEPLPKPKLGLAPLSSELAFNTFSRPPASTSSSRS